MTKVVNDQDAFRTLLKSCLEVYTRYKYHDEKAIDRESAIDSLCKKYVESTSNGEILYLQLEKMRSLYEREKAKNLYHDTYTIPNLKRRLKRAEGNYSAVRRTLILMTKGGSQCGA